MMKKTLITCMFMGVILCAFAQNSPVLDAIGAQSVSDGSILFFKATATDSDGDELKYSISGAGVKARMQIDSVSGLFIWVPKTEDVGATTITVEVSDGTNTDSEEITITIGDAVTNNDIIYVDANASGNNNGTSWTDAYTDLGNALTNAVDGDQLWVADGTYTPDGPGGDASKRFDVTKELALYGGFAGGEISRDNRDVLNNKSVLSGDLNGDDLTTGNDENSDRIYSVTASSLLDGFHVTAANGDRGAAIYAARQDTWVLIRNSVITENNGSGTGVSGILTFGTTHGPSSYSIENCLIADNTTTGRLITLESPFTGANLTQATFINSTIVGNDLLLNGQRAAIVGRFVNCVFDANGSNYTFSLGGAAYQFKDCIFPDDPTTHSTTNITLFENNLVNRSIELTPSYSLALGNPAIDAGDNEYADGTIYGVISKDLSGNTRITDGTVDMGAFEFVPNPANNGPVLDNPLTDQNGTEDSPFNYTIPTDAFSDPDGDDLSYSAKLSDGSKLPDWLNFDGATRTFSGTPDKGEVLTIRVTSSDNLVNVSDEFDLTITDVNDAPVLNAIGDKGIAVGVEETFTVTATDEETSNANLTYSIDATSEGKGMTMDSGTGEFSWTPTPDHEGTHSVTFTVSDDADPAATDTETITITVAPNTAPELTAIGNHSVDAGSMLFIHAEATDAEGHDISFSLQNEPQGMDVFPEQGLISWVPDASQIGTHDVTITASDGLDTDSEIITITVTDASFPITYVDQSATGGNNGTTWEHAFTDLNDALSNVQDGEQIWVAAGTYRPGSVGSRTLEFLVNNRIVMYGGFAGGESDVTERDVLGNPTILSGDLGNDDETVGIADNSYHVITVSTTNSASALDGLVITGGHANGNGSDAGGAALYSISGSSVLHLRNMVIEENTADQHGVSSIVDFGSSSGPSKMIVSNSVFRNNTSTGTVFSINAAVQEYRFTEVDIYHTNIENNDANVVDAQRASINLSFYNSLIWGHTGNYLRMLADATNEFYNCAFDNDPSGMSNSNITVFDSNLIDQVIETGDDHQFADDAFMRNAADNSYTNKLGVNLKDLDGQDRISEGTADLGAVEYRNYAPGLNTSFDLSLDAIDEDEIDNTGTSIASLIDTNNIISDKNHNAKSGIAVTARDETNGTWEYSVDNGSNWTGIGEVSETSALLLPYTDARIRFVPAQDFFGTVQTGISFRAWDQNSGAAEDKVDVTTGDAFSTDEETADLEVVSVNDAPVVDQGMADQSLTEEVQFQFSVSEDAFDDVEDAESLTFSAEMEDGTQLEDISWLVFNGTVFSGTPQTSDIGTYSVRLTATDPDGASVDLVFDIAISKVLSVEKGLDDQVTLFPNAVDHEVHLKINDGFTGSFNVQLMNTMGQVIWNKTLRKTQQNEQFTFQTNMPSGIYFMNISNGEKQVKKRLIKR